MLNIFIGYDSQEPVAYHVLSHSLLNTTTIPLSITPLKKEALGSIYTRSRGPTESTEFSLTRFLVPYLSGYQGYSLFMDSDMLCLSDIYEIMAYGIAYPEVAVSVCKHDYTPATSKKFLGQSQTRYPRKNWSSFMLFNNALCTTLTPDYVNTATGLDLHRFNWVDDKAIGALPLEWNWLVGEYPFKKDVKNVHYTIGTPCFPPYATCDYADLWFRTRDALLLPR